MNEYSIEDIPLEVTRTYTSEVRYFGPEAQQSGIYKIVNKVNNNFYIGSAINFAKRWSTHLCDLNKNKHHSIYLQRAWRLYGPKNFDFIIVEVCKKVDLISREQFYIDTLQPNYNLNPKAGSSFGKTVSVETRLKQSLKRKGALNGMFGKTHSDEVKEHLSKFRTGAKHKSETKQKMSENRKGELNGKFGKPHSEETKAKISASRKGKVAYNKGGRMSSEQKSKVSEGLRRYFEIKRILLDWRSAL